MSGTPLRHYVHSSHQQRPSLCNSSVWWYGKHHYHLEVLCKIPISQPQTLPAIRHVLPRAWFQCRPSLPPWHQPSCLPSSGHCRIWTMQTFLVQLRPSVHSTTRFRVSTSGSWRDRIFRWQHPPEPFRFDQADSMWSVVAPAAPATAAAAVIIFILKADWNWQSVTGSMNFQLWMPVENLRFFTWGCERRSCTLPCSAVCHFCDSSWVE